MAVTQISRIQHRRGLEQDLPQLASAEFGWSLDTRKLYIGNGTLDEGAPTTGITRILTEYDAPTISGLDGTYTFEGNAAGYVAQTGPSLISPASRSFQSKLDDIVNVRDFGALGDGTTDDTAAINRAIQQIYLTGISETQPLARRTIYFPGGTYKTTTPILIPPYARLVGDGINSAIIKQTNPNQSVAKICDSKFQIGASIGTSGAVYPTDIEISGLQFYNSSTSTTEPLVVLDSVSNVRIQTSKFISAAISTYPNLVAVLSNTLSSKALTFDSCAFINGGNGIGITGSGVKAIRVMNSMFNGIANVGVNLGSSIGFNSVGNYFGTVGLPIQASGNSDNLQFGDYYESTGVSSVYLGNLQIGSTQQYTLSTSPTILNTLANTALVFDYEIKNGSNIRLGTFNFTVTPSTILYKDEYIETDGSVNVNLSANSDSIIATTTTGTATFKLSFKQFI